MTAPIPDWTLNNPLRQDSFACAADSPGTWLLRARDLRTAADRIDPEKNPIRDDEPSLGLHSVYRMLMGMSLEAILKGILVAQGEKLIDKGRVTKGFTTHHLHKLAARIDASAFPFSREDLKLLDNLTPYIEWAGKYPIPLVAGKIIIRGHSSMEISLERDLWSRLHDHLRRIGWVSKGRGNRLYFTKP